MVNAELNIKVIKDLEFMAKKLKKRIALLEKIIPNQDSDNARQISILVDQYRMLKREIVEISNMTN